MYEELYPVPRSVGYKMVAKVSSSAVNFLDPSAGNGVLAEIIRGYQSYESRKRNVDCIEVNPELIAILRDKDFSVVGFDWLEYAGVSYYDAIVMNPPFSNGAAHVLKAWDFMYNGEIVALVNAETLRNPFSKERQRLAALIREHGSTEDLGRCFDKSSVRAADVEVVMVYLKKVSADDSADLWSHKTDEPIHEIDTEDPQMLALRDQLGNMEHYYNMGNAHMLQAFEHLRKASLFMQANGLSESDYHKVIGLALENINNARAEFGRKHRRDSWMQVFHKMEFHRWLDKKQREAFLRDVQTNANIPFTAANIRGTLENVIDQRQRLFEQSVANVFDELTKFFNGNTSHTEGWKTNDSYKVNMRLVFPYGCAFDSKLRHFNTWYVSNTIDIYNDLDRVIAVMDGQNFDNVHTIGKELDRRFTSLGWDVKSPFDNTGESTYFHITFYMKGTVHLKWKRRDLWQKFNLTASAGKRWLGENTRNPPADGNSLDSRAVRIL